MASDLKAIVTAKPLGETKGDKIKIFKYRPKTGYAKRAGHRQILTLLEIEEVTLGGGAPKKAAAKKSDAPAKKSDAPKKAGAPEKATVEADAAETSEAAGAEASE